MKICQYCGNRIEDGETECPVCHRPIQDDFTIPQHPENRPLWKWLCIFCAIAAAAFLIVCIRELIVAGFTQACLGDFAFFALCAGVSAIFGFFYHRSI